MQFSFAVLAAAALSLVNAVNITNTAQSFVGITAGTPLTITWTGAVGAVTLTLKDGTSTALKTVDVIASGQTGTSFIWTPSKTLVDGTYALQIDDSTGTPNYSVQFAISGGVASSSAAASSSASATSSGSSSSASSASSTSTSSSASSTITGASNSTITTSGSSSSKTGSSTSSGSSTSKTATSTTSSAASTSTTAAPGKTNGAGSIASPLAFIFLAFAALMTLN